MITLELTDDEAKFNADVLEEILDGRKQRVYGGATPNSVYDKRLMVLYEKLRGSKYGDSRSPVST